MKLLKALIRCIPDVVALSAEPGLYDADRLESDVEYVLVRGQIV